MPTPPTRRAFCGTALASLGLAAWPHRVTAASSVPASAPTPSPAATPAPTSAAAPAAIKPKTHQKPFVYPFNIGAIEAWSISDGHMLFNDRIDKMRPPEARGAMAEELVAHGERLDGIPLYVNVLVLRYGREVVLCDAGFGVRPNPNIGWVADGLAEIGIRREDVTQAILSHGHSDHIGGFINAGKPMFPNAALRVMKAEVDFWRSPTPDFSKSFRRDNIPNMIRDVRAALDILQSNLVLQRDGDDIQGGFATFQAAPGHTDGHCTLLIRHGQESLVHIMDVAHHHVLMFSDPSWFIEFDHVPEQAVATRKRIFAELAGKRTRTYGFHLPWPGIGRVLPRGSGYRWEAERWSWGS
ncbi:MAG: MBL fold metallo-hydrolase [Opitutaceae bacterium]|nr:MBL fold metallo-hydrolase [Opitutaceae bacterium]